jgi:D-alanyl-D-alanine carboxypeptidase (penicillin-binding protein 5/6)
MKNKIKTLLIISFFINLYTFSAKADFEINASTAILQDYSSGEILYEKEADLSIYPASMTKIMTSIIAFELIKKGDLKLNDKFMISEKAWRLSTSGYSSMFIMVGDEVSVENLLKGIIIVSGNDACVALAEGIAGSEEEFAVLMTIKAKEIGMVNTNFANSSGINHRDNNSTVRDILIMSNYLIKNYPKYYEYFSEKEFTWDRTGGEPITQGNRNPLLYKNIGADGIKTGYLAVEKYSLASSIFKNNRRLIAVGSGFNTKKDRSFQSKKMLLWGLGNFDLIEVAKKNKKIDELDVWLGKKDKVSVYIAEDIYKTVPRARKKHLKAIIKYRGPLLAPIKKDEVVGKLKLMFKNEVIKEVNLLSLENIDKKNILSRLITSINYLIWGDV